MGPHDPATDLISDVSCNPRVYLPLAGSIVAGMEEVRVEVARSFFRRPRMARVTARPVPFPGIPAPARCAGTLSFRFVGDESYTGRGVLYYAYTYDVRVTAREGEPPAGLPEGARVPGLRWGMAPMPIVVGRTVRGVLHESGATARSGGLADEYVVDLPAGSPIEVAWCWNPTRREWGPLDIRLTVEKEGSIVATRDADGRSEGSFALTPAAPGAHTLTVATRASGQRGWYTVTVKQPPASRSLLDDRAER